MTATVPSVVGADVPHESSVAQVTGAAQFADDVLEPAGTVHVALGLSPVAHGRLVGIDVAGMQRHPGVIAVLTADAFPGLNDCGTITHDEPILAVDRTSYVGQPVFAVVGADRDSALAAARHGEASLRIEELVPVLDPLAAHEAGQHAVPPFHIERTGDGDLATVIAAAPHRLQGTFESGSQEHVYLETQVCLAIPTDEGGMHVRSSTQHPSEVQAIVAACLALPRNQVQVECRRLGGGFGGKQHQAAQFACIAAMAAHATGRPAKLRLGRQQDNDITGKRHAYASTFDVGFDDDGLILGLDITLVSRAGFSAGLTEPVLLKSVVQADSAYWLPNVSIRGFGARTNTHSSTAMRGFGAPQGALVTEVVIDSIARRLGIDPAVVRQRNYYRAEQSDDPQEWGTTTPYGQKVQGGVLRRLVEQLTESSDYVARRAEIATFNAGSPVLKRGIALTPLKFGISYELRYLNQAGALVDVYTDGSVTVTHSGIEMGQGVSTKILQVVAQELGVGVDRVRISDTDTDKVPNTSATAASTCCDLNGMAARQAARRIRDRLAKVAADRLDASPDDVEFADGLVRANGAALTFGEVAQAAHDDCVQLWSDGFYSTPDLWWDEAIMRGHPFFYFCYGASVSEVVVDTLTGEARVLRADLLNDVGQSINPAIDIGQVEGGFVQGMGWMTMEDLRWDPRTGRLLTHAPTTYKVPTAHDVPPDLRTGLFEVPNSAETINFSKAVGEPPLLLAFSVFLAIRDAISAVGEHRVDPELRVPATSEEILGAITAVRSAVASSDPAPAAAPASAPD